MDIQYSFSHLNIWLPKINHLIKNNAYINLLNLWNCPLAVAEIISHFILVLTLHVLNV